MKNGTFCNMCFKAGKPASDYKSHSVKVKGKVVCPYLLSIECRYCHEKGHTPSGCPVLKRKKRAANEALKKYDVSGLPPMPTVLRPLVMPTSKLAPVPATVRPLVMPASKLVPVPATVRPLVMPASKLVPVPATVRPLVMPADHVSIQVALSLTFAKEPRQRRAPSDLDLSDFPAPTSKLEGVAATKKKIINEKRMSWADMCDTDEEDDEF
jgi:hypothetical protein